MTTLGKYELYEVIGKGGFGTVYRATDPMLGRNVAIKVLHPQLMTDKSFVERFQKEAKILAALEHPNIVTIHELNSIDGRLFLAMQFLSGGSLQQLLLQGPLPFEKVQTILHQICAGLQNAHEKGLVHRDIKPANILFDQNGRAVLSDFGLARAVQVSSTSSSFGIAGTPAYRAPELWRGKPPVSPATDIYSLGCVLFEMLTGRVLFSGNTPDEIITQHLIDGPAFPEQWPDGIPSALPDILKKALEKDPASRQQTADQLLQDIDTLSQPNISVQNVPVSPPSGIHRNKQKVDSDQMSIEIAKDIRLELVRIPAGTFWMGSDPGIGNDDEHPKHEVFLDEFWIGKYPITNRQYNYYILNSKDLSNRKDQMKSVWQNPKGKEDHPAVGISWEDSSSFCVWINLLTGYKIRLPTEAEWEKAARGTDGRIYPWGNQQPDEYLANFQYHQGNTTAVDSHSAGASPYGALDMAGNIWEWTADWYDENYYSRSPASNPTGPQYGTLRVLRGGSWISLRDIIRVAYRDRSHLTNRFQNRGFRCAFSE